MAITTQSLRKPDVLVTTEQIGVVMYAEKRAVGIQFVDPSGQQAFLWIPGKLLALLGAHIPDLVKQHPEILDWDLPPARPGTMPMH